MSTKINAKLCRIALFMIWLIVLMPVYTANALVITFDPGTDMVVTDNLAVINFTTDEEVTAKVFYGLEEATEYMDSKPAKTEHSVEISGIASSTTFKFYIETKNETDTVRSPAEGGDFYGFTTEELRDRTPPRAVTGVAAPAITKTTITLEWKADPRDTDVDHFKLYKSGTLLADDMTELTFTDSGLNSSTEYIYMVSAVDAAGNEGPRTTQKATTRSAAFQQLAITEFKATVFGTSIYATWYTTMPSHTRLRYGQTPLLLDQKKESPEMITAHNISLTGLPPNSNITILAESCDAASNCGNATPVTLRTTQKIDLALQVDGMDCDANTPKFANSNRLDVNGRASLGADVTAYVNGNKLRYKSITDTGTFSFSGLELDPNKAENELRVTASDHISADKVCVEKILLDYYAPQVDFTNDTLNISVVTEQSVVIKGNLTDEHKVTMYAYLQSLDDTVPPPAPKDVTNGTVGPNSITITWSKYGDDVKDAYKYLIYRTDVADGPIAELEPTATEYTDSNVSTTATYTYQVSAFDRAGNEGPKSDPFSITTLSGGTTAPPVSKIVPSNPSMLMTKEFQLSNNTILFTETLGPLFEGKNVLKVQFTDEAGNVFEKEFQLVSDKEPPKILTPDAGMIAELYSPSYMSEILIAGQINKQAGQVWVWVNNNTAEPNYKFDVGENGTFEAEVALSTSVGAAIAGSFTGSASPSRAQGTADVSVSTVTGAGKSNKITMIAVDQYGRRSAPVEATIEYTPCGENYYWDVELSEGGNVINSRELLEGIAAYGFGYELKWIGGGNAALAKPQNVQVLKATVGATEAKKYDFDWIAGEPHVMTNRGNMTKGFVMINFAAQNPPGETYYARESNLSAHRKGECWPYAGCIRLLLQLQIDSEQAPFLPQQNQPTQNTPNTGTGLTGWQIYGGGGWGGQQGTGGWGSQQGTGGSGYDTGQYGTGAGYGNTYDAGAFGGYDYSGTAGAQRIGTQKQCIELKIMIDKRLDPSLIPRGLLEASIKAINATLYFLDLIEVPLKYVTQVTIGLCLLSFLSKFVIDALKSYYCKMSGALSALSSGDIGGLVGAIKEVAQGSVEKIAGMDDGTPQGACAVEFKTSGEGSSEKTKAANEACKSCAEWISKQKWMTDKWHLFCDRITCPAVPSFQHYIFSNWKNGVRSWSMPSGGEEEQPTGGCEVIRPLNTVRLSASCNCGETNVCQATQVCLSDNTCQAVQNPPCPTEGLATEMCACGTAEVCLPNMRCNGQGASARCYGEGATVGDQQCRQSHQGENWQCRCPAGTWKDEVCTANPQNCTLGATTCTDAFVGFQCCSPDADPTRPPRAPGTGRGPGAPGAPSATAGLTPRSDAESICTGYSVGSPTGGTSESYCCCGPGNLKCAKGQCYSGCEEGSDGCVLGFKCGVVPPMTLPEFSCGGTAPAAGICGGSAVPAGGTCKCSPTMTTCTAGQICKNGGCLPVCTPPATPDTPPTLIQPGVECACGNTPCGTGKACSYSKQCLSRCYNNVKITETCLCGAAPCGPVTGTGVCVSGNCRVFSPCATDSEILVAEGCACGNTFATSGWCYGGKHATSECTRKDATLSSNCVCRENGAEVCTSGQACLTGTGCGQGGGGLPAAAILSLPGESVPTPTASSRSTLSLITGFAPADSPTTGTASTPPTGSQTGSPRPPVYNDVVKYEEGNYKRPDIKNAESDCAFAEMGRGPVKEMYTFYDKGDKEKTKLCESGHIPQAACCPFEYMDEWSWGMMFSNELKMSYCLANPDDEEVCGIGETIQRGITGICQPESAHPRATFVVLDDLEYTDVIGREGEIYRHDVAYIVEIDESGSMRRLQRGIFSEAILHQTTQEEISSDGIIEIAPGFGLMPDQTAQDISGSFPNRDNADLSRDSDAVDKAKTALKEDLEKAVIEGKLQRKNNNPTNIFAKVGMDDADEHWFRQIYGLIGDPGRQYLAIPQGSFIQSILTLCLTTMMTWIGTFKNILIRMRQCLQSILLTGDGEAGMCQALVSQYICDLIKEAISCLMNRFGGGGNARVGMGGISGVFASISDASRGLMSEAQERYGENNLFSSNFAAENIVADACMFMFTGEIPTNWDTMLDVATYAPINTTAFIFPATRRFQVYNPETGYARYVYKIAYFISAGADIHYDINLVCSGAEKFCTDSSGNTEQCDCSYPPLTEYGSRGRQPFLPLPTRRGSGTCPENGDMKQLESCDDEIMFVAEGNPLRYDKAVITWRPSMTMGQTQYGMMNQGIQGSVASPSFISGGVEANIDEIGGPPFGLCSFNVPQLAFTCGVEIPPTGYARFVSIDLARPAGEPFGIGDSRIASVRIEQALPQDAPSCTGQCDLTKYLTFEIWNGDSPSSSARIYPPYSKNVVGERLNENRLYSISAFDDASFPQTFTENGEGFEIKREYFGAMAQGASNYGNPVAGTREVKNFIKNLRPSAPDVEPPQVINISIVGGVFEYEEGTKSDIRTGAGAYSSPGNPNECEEQPPRPIDLNSNFALDITCGDVTFNFDTARYKSQIRKETLTDGYAIFAIRERAAPTAMMTCSDQPVTWTMVLSIRDSTSLGGGAGYMMSKAPVTDPDTGRQQLAAIPFQVVCRESAMSRTPQGGSIKDLVAITAQVRADNTEDNSIYGLWTEADSLGPTQTISVGDFEWVTPGPPTQIQDGFRLSIDSTSPFAILNINVGKINLIPGPGVTVQKNDEPLPKCGTPPCVAELGDTRSRIIKLMITAGDPRFTFTGFRLAEGMEGIGPEGIVLTYENPSSPDGAVKLHKPVPAPKTAGGLFELARVTDYRQNDDGFSVAFSVEPTGLLDPLTIGFDVTKMGFTHSGTIAVEGLPLCEGAAAPGASLSVDGINCPQKGLSFGVTALFPEADRGKTVSYFQNPSAGGDCAAGVWAVDGHVLGGESWGAIKFSTGKTFVTRGGIGQGPTGVGCRSESEAVAAATAGSDCSHSGVSGPAAVTDINSESFSLPTPKESKQGTPLITGFAADTLTIQGISCSKGADSGTKVYPAPEQPVFVYDCGRPEYRAVYDDGTIASNIVYRSIDTKFYRTDPSGKPVGGSGGMSRDENIAALGGTPPATTTGTPAPSASTPSGTGTSRTGGSTGATVGAGAGERLSGTVRGTQPCYVVEGNVVGVKTMGSPGAITVRGLGRSEEESISSIKDIPPNSLVVLTAQEPEKRGLSAYRLMGTGRVIIKWLSLGGGSINMEVAVDQPTGIDRLAIELFHAGLKTQGDKTDVDLLGYGSLMMCSDVEPGTPCIAAIDLDRVTLTLPQQESKLIRITGLKDSDRICAGKNLGDPCGSDGGTCRAIAAAPEALMDCVSECRFSWAQRNVDALDRGTVTLPTEDNFCINTNAVYCRDESGSRNIDASTLSAGGCSGSNKCCYTGKSQAKPRTGPGRRGAAAATSVFYLGVVYYKEACKPDEPSNTLTVGKCWHIVDGGCAGIVRSLTDPAGLPKTIQDLEAQAAMGRQTTNAGTPIQDVIAERRARLAEVSDPAYCHKPLPDTSLIPTLERELGNTNVLAQVLAAGGGQTCGNTYSPGNVEERSAFTGMYRCVPSRMEGAACEAGSTITPIAMPCSSGVCCRVKGSDVSLFTGGLTSCYMSQNAYCSVCLDDHVVTATGPEVLPCGHEIGFRCCRPSTGTDVCAPGATCVPKDSCSAENKISGTVGFCTPENTCCRGAGVRPEIGQECVQGNNRGICRASSDCNTARGAAVLASNCKDSVCCQNFASCGGGERNVKDDIRISGRLTSFTQDINLKTGVLLSEGGPADCTPGNVCIPGHTNSQQSCVSPSMDNAAFKNHVCGLITNCAASLALDCPKEKMTGYSDALKPGGAHGCFAPAHCNPVSLQNVPSSVEYCDKITSILAQGDTLLGAIGRQTDDCPSGKVIPRNKPGTCLTTDSDEFWSDACPKIAANPAGTFCDLSSDSRTYVSRKCHHDEWWSNQATICAPPASTSSSSESSGCPPGTIPNALGTGCMNVRGR